MHTNSMKEESARPVPPLVQRVWLRLGSLSLSAQFLIAASLIVFGLMAGVSFFVAAQVEKAARNAAGAAGAVRMQALVAPLIERAENGQFRFDDVFQGKINNLIGQGPPGQRVINIKIWTADGRQIYPPGTSAEEPGMFEELQQALAGQTVVSRTTVAKHQYSDEETSQSLLEIYGPLVRSADGEVLLAGEIYEESEVLERQIAETRSTSMAGVLLLSVPMLSLLYLVVRKGARLIEQQRRTLRDR